jgi:hypothetical protein
MLGRIAILNHVLHNNKRRARHAYHSVAIHLKRHHDRQKRVQ